VSPSAMMSTMVAAGTRFRGATRWLGLPEHWIPKTLCEQTIRELWSFRVSIMGLRTETDPENDFIAFRATLVRCEFVWVDEVDAEIVGMHACSFRNFEHEGHDVAVWRGEYACVAANQRSRWKIVASWLASFATMRLRFRRHRHYAFASAYLPSFLALHHAGHVFLHDDPLMSRWEHSLLTRLASSQPGWDPSSGTIILRTRPVNPRTSPPRDPALREPWERYLAHNPRWHEGVASAALLPLAGLRGTMVRKAAQLLWARTIRSRRPV
jgi:hypothetical protein